MMPKGSRSGIKNQLDWDYIEEQLRPLAEVKNQPEILQTLGRLRGL